MRFVKENSYEIVRLMLNQFAMAVFGLVLTFATRMATDGAFTTLTLAASLLSIGLYLYVLYATVQELGAKDKIRIDGGRAKADKLRGMKLMLWAQIPNFIMLFFMLLGYLLFYVFTTNAAGGGMLAITNVLMYFFQSMYNGLIGAFVGTEESSRNYLMSFLLYLFSVVPGILVCYGSYIMGLKDKTLSSLFRKKS